jgi:hypothetical protein
MNIGFHSDKNSIQSNYAMILDVLSTTKLEIKIVEILKLSDQQCVIHCENYALGANVNMIKHWYISLYIES